jgi:hypothetical protein
VAKVDREGFFYITDRLKELIKYKGLQVAPGTPLVQTHAPALCSSTHTTIGSRA